MKEYISFHNPLSSRLQSKDKSSKIYWNMILLFVLEGRETCSPTLREEHRTREIQNTVFKRRPKI